VATNARRFTKASSEFLSFNIGAFGNMPTAWTMAALVKHVADDVDSAVVTVNGNTGSDELVLARGGNPGSKFEYYQTGNVSTAASLTTKIADDWHVMAITKTAGTTIPRFHKYVRATNTWTHTPLGGSFGNVAAMTSPKLELGRQMHSGSYTNFADVIVQAAGWLSGTALSDVAIEVLSGNLATWIATLSTACVCLNQASVSTTVRDLTGHGSDQSARTGTSVVTGDPGFDDQTIAFDANLGSASPADGTTSAFTTGATVASGGFIVVAISHFVDTPTLSSFAGGGLTWSIDASGANPTASGGYIAICSAQAPSGLASGTTLTGTWSGSCIAPIIGGSSFTGVATSSPVDVAGTVQGETTGTAWTTGNLTLAAGSMLYGGSYNEGVIASATVTSPSTEVWEQIAGGGYGGVAGYRVEASGGSVDVAGAWNVSSTGKCHLGVAYKAAATSPAPTLFVVQSGIRQS